MRGIVTERRNTRSGQAIGRNSPIGVGLLLLVGLTMGCLKINTQTQSRIIADPAKTTYTKSERHRAKSPTVEVSASESDNILVVKAHYDQLCGGVKYTPALKETTEVNELPGLPSVILFGTVPGGLATIAGSLVLATPCTFIRDSCDEEKENNA